MTFEEILKTYNFICLYNSLTLDITDFLRKLYFFIFPYVPSRSEQKGEQISQRKKVIKSTFDNLK
ncbi:TPA: hypothetical protein U1Z93_000089 [Streptococcus suis]|nr:hypothetical protein [Streptococcus suis]HEM4641700.1 hypothetical protein [Streptococcus suis]